jgi:tRNA-Thr(GGU) m(6)t(6)A37 methyltransferase TsaA
MFMEGETMAKKSFKIHSIGKVKRLDNEICLLLEKKYRPGLKGMDRFSHIIVLWFAELDSADMYEDFLVIEPPYARGESLGLFTTRATIRPNPVASTICEIKKIDEEKGEIWVTEIDAYDETAIIDVKPYIPGADRVKKVKLPEWVPEEWISWWGPEPPMDY